MGMYDSIMMLMQCPYCKRYEHIECQTKDLDSAGWNFQTLDKDWFTAQHQRKMRKGMPVFKRFPFDKTNSVWKDQVEETEASARVPNQFRKLKFVTVICDCHSVDCQAWSARRDKQEQGCVSGFGRMFEGKIKIKDGFLIGEPYDIYLSDKRMPKKKRPREVGKRD